MKNEDEGQTRSLLYSPLAVIVGAALFVGILATLGYAMRHAARAEAEAFRIMCSDLSGTVREVGLESDRITVCVDGDGKVILKKEGD